ncbi:MAG: FtsX-like permease family protein [Eubacterium sp.]|nr:FtsX-like permease family protein [Eubacterium sp.]
MNKGMIKTTVREIKGSLGRYLAIFAIVLLGVALFTGLKATTPAMLMTGNDYLAEQNFYDFRLLSTVGFEEADVQKLIEMEQTADAEGAVSVDAVCVADGGNEAVYKFHTVPEKINQIILTAGRMPKKADECVLDSAQYGEDMIGKQIAVTDSNEEDTLEMFGERTFTAVGIVRSPYYINLERGTTSIGEGKITAFLYVPRESFACEYLTEIYVKTKQKLDVYTDAYEDYIDGMQEEIEGKTEALALARYEKITGEARKEIDDAQEELDEKLADAHKELADARKKIADGEQEIVDGEQELRDGKRKAADGERELAANERKLSDSERKLLDGEREIREKEQEIRDAQGQLSQAEQEISANEKKLADGKTELAQAKAKLQKEQTKLQKEEAALPRQETQLQKQETALVKKEEELTQQEAELAGQETELLKKEAELKEQETELMQQEAALKQQETTLLEKEAELVQQEAALRQQETALENEETALDSQQKELNLRKEQLEQAYAAHQISHTQYENQLQELQTGLHQLQAGKAELAQAKAQLQAGKKQLQEGRSQVQEGLVRVQSGLTQVQPGLTQLQEGLSQVREGLTQVQGGLSKVREGLTQVREGLVQVRAGYKQLQDGKQQIAAGKKQLAAAKAEIASNEKTLAESEQQLAAGKAETADARMQLETGRRELEKGKAELQSGRIELADGKRQLADAREELADARAELKQGRKDLDKGKAELADARREYADAKAELNEETADAQQKIDDARTELAEVEKPDTYALTRNTNIGYACYESDSNIVAGIANVFPVFFFLVAALICMTTMNRMVEEQRTQIGVLKALGYGNGTIMGKYLFYAGSAAAAGAVAGCIIGTWLFPKVIWMGYSIMYSMGEITYYFDWWMAFFSLLAALLCSMGAAYASCRYELYSVPASLIRPKAPKGGKRIFLENVGFIWSRMKFLHKVSVRNIFRYKKRFFMMILGISGCTALLLTGFGVKDSVTNVADMQYDEIEIYDIGITFSENVTKEDLQELDGQTGNLMEWFACRYEESVDLDFGGKTKSMYLGIAQDTEEIADFLKLRTKSGEKISYPSAGEAALTVKTAETMGIRVGDQVVLRDSEMNSLTVKVSALYENFIYNCVYISKETYMEQLGKEPEYKSAYVVVKDGVDVHMAAASMADQGNVLSVSITQDMRERIASMMKSMDYIVLLIILCAGSLAFIVLYNLTNINITERIREIATIKVLGFYARETADYVFRENLALTGLGALAGLGLGKWLHWFVMDQVKIDMISFKTMVAPMSYLWSLALTFAFAMLVNGLMYFKLEHIHMAEALKSIE